MTGYSPNIQEGKFSFRLLSIAPHPLAAATPTKLYSKCRTRMNLIPVKKYTNVGSDYESS